MMVYWRFMLLALALAASLSTRAQSGYNLPPLATYRSALIGFEDLGRVTVTDLRIAGDSVAYSAEGKRETRHLDEVSYIRVREGSNVGRGLGIGAAAGLSIGLPVILNRESNVGTSSGAIVALATGIGAGIGTLVGAAFPRRRSYYVRAQTFER